MSLPMWITLQLLSTFSYKRLSPSQGGVFCLLVLPSKRESTMSNILNLRMLPKTGYGSSLLKSHRRGHVGRRESLLYFLRPATSVGGQTSVQRPTPPPAHSQWARALRGWGRGLCAETARSALILILKLVTGGLTSIILIVLSTVNL